MGKMSVHLNADEVVTKRNELLNYLEEICVVSKEANDCNTIIKKVKKYWKDTHNHDKANALSGRVWVLYKRNKKEKATMFEMGAKSIIEKMLPVVDNLERGLASVPEDQQSGSVYEGMNLIYKQLMSELDKIGVKPIEALGTEFNPDFHNAVMQVESGEFEEA